MSSFVIITCTTLKTQISQITGCSSCQCSLDYGKVRHICINDDGVQYRFRDVCVMGCGHLLDLHCAARYLIPPRLTVQQRARQRRHPDTPVPTARTWRCPNSSCTFTFRTLNVTGTRQWLFEDGAIAPFGSGWGRFYSELNALSPAVGYIRFPLEVPGSCTSRYSNPVPLSEERSSPQ
jgi:hypothetical protein